MLFDEMLELIGDFGPYQRRTFIVVGLMAIPTTWHLLLQVFTAGHADHWCYATETDNINCSYWNLTQPDCKEAIRDATVPVATKLSANAEYESCRRYNLSGTGFEFYPGVDPTSFTNTTMMCDAGWVYDRSQYKSTIITDFDLVCSRSFLPDLAQSLFFAGAVLGSVSLGSLADRFGRRPVLFLAVLFQFLLGAVVVLSPNIATYVVFRTLQGIVNDTVLSLAFVFGAEFVGPKRRVLAGMLVNCTAAIGVISLAGIASLARHWRGLQLFLSTPSLLALLAIRFVPESARWLYSIGRHDEAHKILEKAATVNKVVIPRGARLSVTSYASEIDFNGDFINEDIDQSPEQTQSNASLKDLLRYPKLRSRLIIAMAVGFTTSLIYFGLTLDTGNLGDRDYLNFFMSGSVELIVYLFCIFALDKFGRKFTEAGSLTIAGVGCIVAELVPSGWWKTLVAMIGKAGASGAIATIPIYIIELMPTPIRSVGSGLGWMAIELGSITAPLTFIASSYLWEPLAYFLFGGFALVAALLTLLLPETKGRPLPETMEEGENLGSLASTNAQYNEANITDSGIATISNKTNQTELRAIVNPIYEDNADDKTVENERADDVNDGTELASKGNNTNIPMEGTISPIFEENKDQLQQELDIADC